MTEAQAKAALDRCAKAAPGPWWWEYCYECYPLCAIVEDDCGEFMDSCQGKHLALVNDASRKRRRVIDYSLVLLTAREEDISGRQIVEKPEFQFIANSRADLPAALEMLQQAMLLLDNGLAGWSTDDLNLAQALVDEWNGALRCSGCGTAFEAGEGEELRHHQAECDGVES